MDRKIVALFRLLAVAMVLGLSAQSAAAQTTYYSRAPGGNWNSSTTWSTIAYDDPTNSGTFPVAGDIVFIGGSGSVVTITGAAAACATLNIDDNSSLNVANSLTVSGTTTVGSGSSGVLSITALAGAKLFIGQITINNGALWNEVVNEAIVFRGGITNNGTFSAGTGIHTFNTNSQSLIGTFSIPNVTINGGAVVLTNTNTLTVGTALSGTGRITQGAGATLNIGGTSAITNMTATAAGNTVNYNGAAQTVHSNAYENLTLSGSGIKTLQAGTTAITGDLTISGTASATAVAGLTIGGDVTLSGGSFTAGPFTHNVGGDWTNNGTFTGTGSVINLNGTAQNISGVTTTFNDLQLSGSGTKTFAVSTTIGNELSIASGAIANLSNANTYTSNTLILAGALQGAGTWGSTSSAAANQNNTFFSGNGLITVATGGFTYYSIASADWSAPTTWSTTGFAGGPASQAPGASDYVIIGNGQDVVVTGTQLCDVLLFDENSEGTLSINSGSLTIGTSLTIPQSTSASNALSVAGGTLVSPNLDFTAGGGAGHQLSISTGTATISGDITGIGASSTIAFSGSGTLQVGGAMFTSATGTLTAPSGTVEYNGAAQTVQALPYRNLTLSGSGNKTLAGTTTISGNLLVGDNTTFIVGAVTLVVTGTTTVGGGTSGILSITSTTGTKTFTDLVTIAANGTWSNTTEAVTFQGGITNNGTFTAGTGVHTFNTNSQALTGTLIIPSVTVTGGAVVLTNTNTLTVSTALSGTGRITQGAGATLNIGGTSGITNMTATAAGNTVNYNGAAQTVHSNAYENLTLSGSGIKTLQAGTTAITGDLTISGTASATAVAGLTIGGDVTLSGGSFTAGPFTHNVGGDWTNNGTFTGTGSVINLNGTAQNISGVTTTFNDLQLSGSGTKTFAVSTTIGNELSIASGAIANLSNANTYTSNTLILAGALQGAGTWGSTSSAAANQNNTFFSGNGLITVATGGFTYYSIASADWSAPTTWSTTGFAGGPASQAPGASDYVIIGNGQDVVVTGTQLCDVLLFDENSEGTLSINSGSLTIGTSLTIPQSTSASNALSVAGGTLVSPNLDFTAGGGAGHQLSISTGTATISGDITGIGASSTIAFSGSGTLQVGGAMFTSATGTLTAPSGTVEYNGAAQTVQALPYRNLTLSGSGNKTLAATTTISGNLLVGDNTTFIVGAVTLVVTGTTTVGGGTSGILSITSTTGTKTFTDLVTIAANGTWSNTTEAVTFQGGITNNGTFTAGTGVHTFNTNSQALTGTLIIPSVTVTGGAVVLTNTNTLTVSTALSGTGRITQGAGATLNIGGTSGITNMTATATGNTVNYNGAAQTVHSNAYENLTLSGSGIKTLQAGTTAITGDLTISGTANTTAVAALTIGGDVTLGNGTNFTAGAFTHNVAGDWINNGTTFTATGSVINFNGTAQNIGGSASTTFNDVLLSGTGTKTFAVSTTIGNELSIASGAIANLSNANTYTSNTLILAGALQGSGTWGSTASAAANQNNTFFSGNGLITVATGGFTYYSIASTDWGLASTWSTTGFFGGPASSAPGAGDYVIIGNGRSVTVTGTEQCEELLFDAGTSVTNALTINSGSLAVNADIIIPQTVTSGSNTLTVAAGSVSAANLDFTASGSGAGHQLSIGAGTVTISGDITGSGVSSTIAFTGSGTLQVGGAMFSSTTGTLTAPSGTVEYNGAAQTVQALPYRNLTLSGSGTKTLSTSTNTTIGGNLVVGDNTTFSIGGSTVIVTGTTTIGSGTGGTLSITATAGTKTFTGLVTVSANGTWTNSTEAVTFQGGITNNGTFTAGTGTQTFSAAQTLTGTLSIPTMNVAGAGVFAVTNNGTLTVSTSLLGTDQFAQGIGGVLNLGGTSTISVLNATASGNTVNFSGGAQTVNNTNYFNLTLSGSGAKTLQGGTTLISGNFTLTGTASTTAAAALTIGGDLDIGSGTSFTSGAFDHVIGGNFINDGTFNHSNRRITFSGITTQSIGGSVPITFFDLHIAEGPDALDVEVNNTGGVNLVSELTFDADAVFDADGPGDNRVFTLISTASGDARIGPLGGTADVIGNITVQRYMDAEGKIYRYISTPVTNATAQDLQGEIPITGPFTGSSFTAPDVNCPSCTPCTGCVLDNTSMYRYDETIVAALNNRYTPFPSVGGTNSETMIPGRGYAVYIRNDVSATTWNLRGPMNVGEVNLNPSITGSNDGFNLVGNPYPSPIDWESGAWTRNGGINPTIYTWDNSISNYASYTIGGASSNGGSRYIAHGQAFWVLASGTPDLRAQEGIKASRASVAQATFFRTAQVDQVRVKLIAANSSDEMLIKVNHQGATYGYDARIDALEFPSDTLLSLHAVTPDKKWLAVNQLGMQTESGSEINVGLAGTKPGSYKLDFVEFENFSTPTSVYLFDRYDDVLVEILPSDKEYHFTVTEDPVSAGDRFVLFITPAGKQPMLEKFEATQVSVYPNPTVDKVTVRVKSAEPASASVFSSIGTQVIDTSELIKSGNQRIGQFDLSSLPAGVYILQIQSGKNLFNKRIMKQ